MISCNKKYFLEKKSSLRQVFSKLTSCKDRLMNPKASKEEKEAVTLHKINQE